MQAVTRSLMQLSRTVLPLPFFAAIDDHLAALVLVPQGQRERRAGLGVTADHQRLAAGGRVLDVPGVRGARVDGGVGDGHAARGRCGAR